MAANVIPIAGNFQSVIRYFSFFGGRSSSQAQIAAWLTTTNTIVRCV
jgi:hypothetical protein